MKSPFKEYEREVLSKTRLYVRECLSGEASGHDHFHAFRVERNALLIAKKEGGDPFVVALAALLHDLSDWKFNGGNTRLCGRLARDWLQKFEVPEKTLVLVEEILNTISFKGAKVRDCPGSLEGSIVQDADRLDALGAVGIARAFAYGGMKGRPLYDPRIQPVLHESFEAYKNASAPTLNHFYEKLFLLRDRMNTATAKKMALKRHKLMESFVTSFLKEWGREEAIPGSC